MSTKLAVYRYSTFRCTVFPVLVADYSNKRRDVISLKDVDDVMAKLIDEMGIRTNEDKIMSTMADVK